MRIGVVSGRPEQPQARRWLDGRRPRHEKDGTSRPESETLFAGEAWFDSTKAGVHGRLAVGDFSGIARARGIVHCRY